MNEEFISPVLVDKIEVSDDGQSCNVYADGMLIASPRLSELKCTLSDASTTSTIPSPSVYDGAITASAPMRDYIDGELVPLLCSQFGGRLDPDTLCCKFCGTYYKIRK